MFKKLKTAAVIAALTTAGAANAASDGSVGTSSTGTSDITVTIPKLVVVKNIGDMSKLDWTGTGNIDVTTDLCVGGNTTGGTYKVRVNGSGAGSAYTLANGANTLAYTVAWANTAGAAFAAGTGMTTLTDLTAQSLNSGFACGSDTNTLAIRITEAAAQAAESGDYTGTATVIVAAE